MSNGSPSNESTPAKTPEATSKPTKVKAKKKTPQIQPMYYHLRNRSTATDK